VDRRFDTMQLPVGRDVVAPDGSDVRILLQAPGGSMAHFELAPGQTSRAVAHRTVDEVWYVLGGQGEMWRSQAGAEETVTLRPGTCLSIPVGTHFQFRSTGKAPLTAVAVTMPPWPGEGEAYEVPGTWRVAGPAPGSAPSGSAPGSAPGGSAPGSAPGGGTEAPPSSGQCVR
jgi:mannose-6-phosphate isomerase-like protein (cupin superfamily)